MRTSRPVSNDAIAAIAEATARRRTPAGAGVVAAMVGPLRALCEGDAWVTPVRPPRL